jgi:methionyl-tRNA synthetase
MEGRRTFYITTAIDYPNGTPHMGHAYEKIVTDAYARWYRLLGRDVWFLTGTDENGQKLAKAAAEAKLEPRRFVDENVAHFRALCEALKISNDDFIRTTEPRHIAATTELWQRLEKAGDVYFDRYSGHYCYGCEAFYPKTQAPDLKCPSHGTPLDFVEEEGYFFRLSKYQSWIQSWLEATKDAVLPASARSEMLGRLRADDLRDLSISRPNQGWGIPVPGRPEHVVYTWFDALINYWAAVQYGDKQRPELWPCDVHVIGKDITWFHAVIWPCMLHAAGVEPPRQVWVHGMVLAEDGRKMSKSLGNGVDPYDMLSKYGLDAFRYYLLRAIAAGQDGAFSELDLRTRYNNELANVYGNTFQRVVKFTLKKFGGELAPPAGEAPSLDMRKIYDRMTAAMDDREHNRALDALWDGLNEVNAYLNANEPWRIKDDDAKVHRIVYGSLHAMHALGALVSPFLPDTGRKTLALLGTGEMPLARRFEPATFRFGEPEQLFPRLE